MINDEPVDVCQSCKCVLMTNERNIRVQMRMVQENLVTYFYLQTEPSSGERSLLSFEDDHEELADKDARPEEAIEESGETKKTVTMDPCSPPKGKKTAEEFSAMLGVPVPTSIEEHVEGRAYLQELEAVRSRVYPRISEFHSIE
ncbi:uncharacterized protein LOC143342012 [Colletes latitarsis]|uniref:uncharacterized protein LOC143342012 n=1 Tax=Colletes latitarsis TaxID=2605962 RepID=UPI00403534E5